MLFRVHADTEQGERVTVDVDMVTADRATAMARQRWEALGIKIAKVMKTKVVKAVSA